MAKEKAPTTKTCRSKKDKVDIGTHVLPKGFVKKAIPTEVADRLIEAGALEEVRDPKTAEKQIEKQTAESVKNSQAVDQKREADRLSQEQAEWDAKYGEQAEAAGLDPATGQPAGDSDPAAE